MYNLSFYYITRILHIYFIILYLYLYLHYLLFISNTSYLELGQFSSVLHFNSVSFIILYLYYNTCIIFYLFIVLYITLYYIFHHFIFILSLLVYNN